MTKNIPFHIGLERESLRMTNDAKEISKIAHPPSLGDPLSNRRITMDFAESQLELITPVFSSHKNALHWLEMTMSYVMQKIGNESLWPMSLPPPFEKDVAIATFGNSQEGITKHLYRRGLANRFSREKQLLCGFHYNFSFQDSFLEKYKESKGSTLPTRYFASECYLHMIRNFVRYGWIISYFYGASPFPLQSMEKDSFPFATSMRQSRYGYTNTTQQHIALNYNSLTLYLEEIRALTKAICPAYEKYGDDQLSKCVLQIDKEHYFPIRPRRIPSVGINKLDALEKDGIQYLEVRVLDINPLYRSGTSIETLEFIRTFLHFCLFRPSSELSEDELYSCLENHFTIAERGLEKDLALSIEGKKKSVDDWISKILLEMDMDPPEVMPTKLNLMASNNPNAFAIKRSKIFAIEYRTCGCSQFIKDEIEQEILLSNIKKFVRENPNAFPIKPIKEMEMSTQVLIRDAILKGLDVEILDRKEHFIKLKNGRISETIKNATYTRKDPFTIISLKGNKSLTKKILKEHDLKVPEGTIFSSKQDANQARVNLPMKNLVIKPNTTNMGISVHFVDKDNKNDYERAAAESLTHSNQVIVEEFIEGDEYRFLVIQNKVVAVSKRVPANVIGNGLDTIEKLIEEKNKSKLNNAKIEEVLSKAILEKVLPAGERFNLRQQSNISTGGDAVDMTDEMPLGYKILAQRATAALGSSICGVDMIIKDISTPATTQSYSIIELNYNPMLSMHSHPDQGESRDVTTPIFKLLGLL